MAQGIQLDRSRFTCVICLDLLNNPVTLPCGHNYCMNCINDHLDKEFTKNLYSCPQCRHKFLQRPTLEKNTMLAFVVDELKKTAIADDSTYGTANLTTDANTDFTESHYANMSEDVLCDICIGRKHIAVMYCCQCLESYCQQHLQPHYNILKFQTHKLIDPKTHLQNNSCARHQEELRIFCRTDQQCICYICSKDEHKGHTKVAVATERVKKQKELNEFRLEVQQRIQNKEKDVKTLWQEEESVNKSAEKALTDAQQIFSELFTLIESRVKDICDKIKSCQSAEVLRFQKVREKLEQEIAELRKQEVEIDHLSKTENHTNFLLNYPNTVRLSEDIPSVIVHRSQYFDKSVLALAKARDKIHKFLGEEYEDMQRQSKTTLIVSQGTVSSTNLYAQPRTNSNAQLKNRTDFLHYARQITLNPNTANGHLVLSNENRKVAFVNEERNYPYHPDRFLYSWQILSVEELTGRCYWEVERTGKGVIIAVAYKDISRQGSFTNCVFGHNDKSWALDCFKNSFEFRHNGVKTHIHGNWCGTIGVYLDHRAGVLAFYCALDKITLLHKVQTTFTQPLHVGLWLADGATAEIRTSK